MDPTSSAPSLDHSLFELSDDDGRKEFFERHSPLMAAGTVQKLCTYSLDQLRVDLELAEAAAATAGWVASRLDDEICRGRSSRALANVRILQRDNASALELSEAALEHFDNAGDQTEAAVTRSSGIQSLINLGQYERAFEWIERARGVFRDTGDDLRLARLEQNAGAIWARQDRPEEALRSFQAALEVCRRLGDPADIGICLRNIAVCWQDLHDLSAAESAYAEARDYLQEHDLPLLLLEVEYNVAYLYYLRGEYIRAIKQFEAGCRNSERLGDRHHRALADLDQSEIFLELNLVEEAASLADRACGAFDELGMNYEKAKALTNRAIAAGRLGKVQRSLELLQDAREVFSVEGNPVWPATLDLYRAIVLFSEGRFFESAQYAGDALESFGGFNLPSKTAMCEIVLARLTLEEGDATEALARCTAALETLEPLGLPALEHQALVVRGRAYELIGDRSAALATYDEAQSRLERMHRHWQTDEFRMAFLEDRLLVYESLVALGLQTGPESEEPSPEAREQAFDHIEKAKSRSLADLIAFRAHAIAPRSEQPETVEHLRRTREKLAGYYGQINVSQRERGADSGRTARLRRKAEDQEEQLSKILGTLQGADREFSSLQTAATASLAAIQASIPENSALLEYFFARGVVYGCVIHRNSLEIVPVAAQSHVQELQRSLQFQFSKFMLSPSYMDQFEGFVEHATNTYLRALYEELVAPFAAQLECEHLTIVPHEFLHHLPFHALFDGERHLIDRYSISYAPSASVSCLCAMKKAADGEGALVLGVGGEIAPWILDEAKGVAEAQSDSTLLIGQEATFARLQDLGGRCRRLHLATHGSFRSDNPMFSAIQFGDREISLFDFYGLDLNAELLVLTGCGTGLNPAPTADEFVGLTRGLLYAGARTLLVTLWDANDESRTIFMRDFYRHLGETSHPAEALRLAVKDLRDLFDHPYFWAPFVLVGSPTFA